MCRTGIQTEGDWQTSLPDNEGEWLWIYRWGCGCVLHSGIAYVKSDDGEPEAYVNEQGWVDLGNGFVMSWEGSKPKYDNGYEWTIDNIEAWRLIVLPPTRDEIEEMSYDIYLRDPETGKAVELASKHHIKGGTHEIGGCTEAWINVTYNYAKHFVRVLGDGGIRSIYGKTAAESLPVLHRAISQLGDDLTERYWDATEGNAKEALRDMCRLALLCPSDAVWDGD